MTERTGRVWNAKVKGGSGVGDLGGKDSNNRKIILLKNNSNVEKLIALHISFGDYIKNIAKPRNYNGGKNSIYTNGT